MKRFTLTGTICGSAVDLHTDNETLAHLVAEALTQRYAAPIMVWQGSTPVIEHVNIGAARSAGREPAFRIEANDAYLPYPRNN